MSTVFVSYRRALSPDITGRICDHLKRRLGDKNVFRDVDEIVGGSNFRSTIRREVASRDALLVVIDPLWLNLTNKSGLRRLDDPNDLVRLEIETALAGNKLIIPLMVSGAVMPEADTLPDSLKPLADLNAIPIRSDPDFNHDISRLVGELARSRARRRTAARGVFAAAIVVSTGLGLYASGAAEAILPSLQVRDRANSEQSIAASRARAAFVVLLEREFRKEIEAGEISYSTDGRLLEIRFPQEVLFSPGRYELHPRAEPLLERLATIFHLSADSTRASYEQILIEGHTDDVPIRHDLYPRDNWDLSSARALSVLRYLTRRVRHPLEERRTSIHSYGGNRPVSKVRSRNRRVEIRVYFSGSPGETGGP